MILTSVLPTGSEQGQERAQEDGNTENGKGRGRDRRVNTVASVVRVRGRRKCAPSQPSQALARTHDEDTHPGGDDLPRGDVPRTVRELVGLFYHDVESGLSTSESEDDEQLFSRVDTSQPDVPR